jgi:hypothetical protein
MSPDMIAALDANLASMLEHLGTPAEVVPSAGPAVACDVSIAELADDYVQRRYGHDRTRMADVLVRRAVLAVDPRHGDRVIVPDGAHAGAWTVIGIERRDEVSVVLRVRRSDRHDAAAPGSSEVRR